MAMKDNYGKQESEKYWNIMIKQLLTFLKILDNTPDNFLAWPNTEEAMWLDKQIDLYTFLKQNPIILLLGNILLHPQ